MLEKIGKYWYFGVFIILVAAAVGAYSYYTTTRDRGNFEVIASEETQYEVVTNTQARYVTRSNRVMYSLPRELDFIVGPEGYEVVIDGATRLRVIFEGPYEEDGIPWEVRILPTGAANLLNIAAVTQGHWACETLTIRITRFGNNPKNGCDVDTTLSTAPKHTRPYEINLWLAELLANNYNLGENGVRFFNALLAGSYTWHGVNHNGVEKDQWEYAWNIYSHGESFVSTGTFLWLNGVPKE